MSFDPHANFAYSTVATAPSPATSGTTASVQTGDGSKFPATPFNVTVWPAGAAPTTANAEIWRVTAMSGDNITTMVRAQEGSSARTVVVGDQIGATFTKKTLTDVEQAMIAGFCGDGSDGNVTISTTVTLTRDMFYDTLTVSGTGVLKPNGFRIFCKTACIVQASGVISYNGNDAVADVAGASVANSNAPLGGSTATGGGAGGTGVGANGTAISSSYGGSTSAGGSGTPNAGGPARTASAPSAQLGSIRSLPQAMLGMLLSGSNNAYASGGAGASAGGGDGTNKGGGGGSGGGVMVINARSVTNSGTISANGGAGGNATAGNCGGGSGGGGGVVIINTMSFSGTTPVANGGALGTKTGTGTNGSAGNAGNVFVNTWS